jgi:hypothetical protein
MHGNGSGPGQSAAEARTYMRCATFVQICKELCFHVFALKFLAPRL